MQTGVIFFAYLATVSFGVLLFWVMRRRDARRLGDMTEMVHQLRTPLSSVKWALKILLDGDAGKITPEEKELLTKSFAANGRMIALVNDILAVARLESGMLNYHFVPVHVDQLMREVIASVHALAQAKGLRVEFAAPQSPLPPWNADAEKICDVFSNILDNAIKYTQTGGMITVAAEVKDDALHVSVKDNGIGIPDAVKKKIFTRFFRATNAVATDADGSGLGLFIAKRIVERHGGTIWFESVPDGGTTFHVLLPRVRS